MKTEPSKQEIEKEMNLNIELRLSRLHIQQQDEVAQQARLNQQMQQKKVAAILYQEQNKNIYSRLVALDSKEGNNG